MSDNTTLTAPAIWSAAVPPDTATRLTAIGAAPDTPFDLADVALMLAGLDQPGTPLEPYRAHLAALAAAVAKACDGAQGNRSATVRAAALIAVLRRDEGYAGDLDTYEDLQNANLIQVIDRHRGLPVALGILYLHAARAQGWTAHGLAFPGHFLCAVESGAERVIIDPFCGQVVEGANGLRALVKAVAGAEAELHPAYCAALDDRFVLLRLLNNIKTRLAGQGRFAEAVAVTERMLMIAPEEITLHRDLGAFHAETGNLKAALAALKTFVGTTRDIDARHQAAALAQNIAARLN